MAKLNLSQAAKVVGKNRVTLWRHINAGKLSAERDRDGNPLVDTSELLRVYGVLKQDATHEPEKKQHNETPSYEELLQLVKEMRKEQSEMKSLILDLSNRLEYKPEPPATQSLNKDTNSRYVDDPEWPQEIKTIGDLLKREDMRNKSSKS